MRPDGSDQRHLVRGAYVAPTAYGWVPGRREIFAHGGGLGQRVLVITPSGAQHQIGRPFHGGLVTLTRGGGRIAWTHQRYGKDIQVRSSRADASDFRVLARFASIDGIAEIDTLAWSPNGRELLVEPHRHIGD